MPQSDAELLAFLQDLDDPEWLEQPRHYNEGPSPLPWFIERRSWWHRFFGIF
jgi:hypothetical protein